MKFKDEYSLRDLAILISKHSMILHKMKGFLVVNRSKKCAKIRN